MSQNDKQFPWKEVLSFLGVVLVAYIGYLGVRSQIEIPIQATQTAEAKLPTSTLTPIPTNIPKSTSTLVPTETITQTSTPTSTPTPQLIVIADTSNLVGWVPYFDSSKGDKKINAIRIIDNTIEITFDVGKDGYVGVAKNITSRAISDTDGISFLYKGMGAPNTIEFKLILTYPGDNGDTTYGYLWNRATNTDDKWIKMEALYSDMTCWWPEENCFLRGDLLDSTMIKRVDFAISNKQGDDEGLGWIRFKDVLGILP